MTTRKVWIEVIDPETGRKIDVVVSTHTRHPSDTSITTEDPASRILCALEAAGFGFSDLEYQDHDASYGKTQAEIVEEVRQNLLAQLEAQSADALLQNGG